MLAPTRGRGPSPGNSRLRVLLTAAVATSLALGVVATVPGTATAGVAAGSAGVAAGSPGVVPGSPGVVPGSASVTAGTPDVAAGTPDVAAGTPDVTPATPGGVTPDGDTPGPGTPDELGGSDGASGTAVRCNESALVHPVGGAVPEGTNYTIDVRVDETDGSVITYAVSARVPDRVTDVLQYVPLDDPRVVSMRGFESDPVDGGPDHAWYRWDGVSERISLTYRYEVPDSAGLVVAADDWGYVPMNVLRTDATWYFEDADRTDVRVSPSTMDEFALRATGGTAVRGGYAVTYGEPGTWTRETVGHDNGTILVAAPTSADPATPVAELAERLDADLGDADLRPGDAHRRVGMVAIPDGRWDHCGVGVTFGAGSAAVVASEPYDRGVGSTWLHEYVHTQQRFDASGNRSWFVEASAEYLEYRLRADTSRVSEATVRERLLNAGDYQGSVLADRSTWESDGVPYYKGARLLYGLDAEIRAATGGEATFEDVFRELNAAERGLDRPVIADAVENASGRRMDEELTAWTESTDSLDRLVADADGSLFPRGGVDVTGDGRLSTNLDDDPRHADVTGDGRFSIADVQALFVARDSAVVESRPALFDFNDDGEVDIVDVQILFTRV